MRPLSRPECVICLQGMWFSGAIGGSLARVAVTFRIMPEDAEVDLKAVTKGLQEAFGEDLRDVVETPVAFGLVALETMVLMDDAGGLIEESEKSIQALKGVSSVETLSVDLV